MSSAQVPVGATAPDFTLRDQLGQEVTLSSFRGKKAVALVFYPFAFSGVCTGELTGIRQQLAQLQTFDTEVLAVSCDPIFSLTAFADREGLNFSLLSDFWPHGEVAQRYGVFYPERGHAWRSSFVIDSSGTVRWSVHNEPGQARDLDELVGQLRAVIS